MSATFDASESGGLAVGGSPHQKVTSSPERNTGLATEDSEGMKLKRYCVFSIVVASPTGVS
jgi:hypothetical protein